MFACLAFISLSWYNVLSLIDSDSRKGNIKKYQGVNLDGVLPPLPLNMHLQWRFLDVKPVFRIQISSMGPWTHAEITQWVQAHFYGSRIF